MLPPLPACNSMPLPLWEEPLEFTIVGCTVAALPAETMPLPLDVAVALLADIVALLLADTKMQLHSEPPVALLLVIWTLSDCLIVMPAESAVAELMHVPLLFERVLEPEFNSEMPPSWSRVMLRAMPMLFCSTLPAEPTRSNIP